MRRREFITLLGSAAVWPLAAQAQQSDRRRRVGVLMAFDENDPQTRGWLSNFTQGLAELGWTAGHTAQIDVRWAAGSIDRMRTFAKELVELQPDVILAGTTPVTAALQRETSTIPIVFVLVSDPVGAGFVAGLPRPGGNITGFTNIEGGTFGGKWLELLKEIAPRVRRVAIMFNPDTAPGGGAYFLGPFEAAARSLAMEPITSRVRSDAEIETAIASLGREQVGLVIMADSFMLVHRGTVISQAARNNVPTIGADFPVFAREGGLLSYGSNFSDIFRRAAPYVDRILRGANPGELPVQAPTKYELVINLKTAKALGLDVPLFLQERADEVIE
jgi:putative tryptophan/tyrosine transport system substrate-binding protein